MSRAAGAYRLRSAALGALLAAGLVGCGQRGPLELPESARPIERAPSPAPAQPPSAGEARDDERENER